jgi:endoglucanase
MPDALPAFAALVLSAASVLAAPAGTPEFGWRTSRYASISGNVLTVAIPADKPHESASAMAAVDLAPYVGKVLVATVRCRGKDITPPREKYNGLKFQFHYKDAADGTDKYPNTAPRLGSFDERELSVFVDLTAAKPADASLTLGLQDSSGTVAFDLSTLRFTVEGAFYPVTNQTYRVSYPDRVKSLRRLRGVMLPAGPCKEDDFRTLRDWGATLARFQMARNWGRSGTDQDLADYDRWIDSELGHLEQVLAWAGQYGLKIVVDLHQPPGGRTEDSEMAMFYDKRFADHFVAVWQKIAARFKGRPEIFGFDLINEPLQKRRAPFDYWTLQRMAAEAVRAVDPDTPVIIESNEWDSAPAYRYLSPLAMDNVIYQVHMYLPFEFTHQGVFSADSGVRSRVPYPDPGRKWDREYLRHCLQPVLDFQRRHNARIYVGEFSAITWAPGSDRYIADCISLFNEYGWDWSFHAFREWPGWSVEHTGNAAGDLRPSPDNPRKRALLSGFAAP